MSFVRLLPWALTALLLGAWPAGAAPAVRPPALKITQVLPPPPARLGSAGGSEAESIHASMVLVTAAVERHKLPDLPASLEVDALGGIVRIEVDRAPESFARSITRGLGALCDRVTVDGRTIELHCRERRLDASVVEAGADVFLDVRVLRGLPWRPAIDAPPMFPLAQGERCPGANPLAQGECAFVEGNHLAAEKAFRRALGQPTQAPQASLRMGDIALASDDIVSALRWWRLAGTSGIHGRLAAARTCEIGGACLGQPSESMVFDATGLPEPQRTEMELRRVRAQAFGGDVLGAAQTLLRRARQTGRPFPCASAAEGLCRRVILEALQDPSATGVDVAMEMYLLLPDRGVGPLAAELARAAARVSERMGAPGFAAQLMSAANGAVAPNRQESYLRETLRLYLLAHDAARARVIVDYVRTRLPPTRLASPEWRVLLGAVPAVAEAARREAAPPTKAPPPTAPPPPGGIDDADFQVELAKVAAASAQARQKSSDIEAEPDNALPSRRPLPPKR